MAALRRAAERRSSESRGGGQYLGRDQRDMIEVLQVKQLQVDPPGPDLGELTQLVKYLRRAPGQIAWPWLVGADRGGATPDLGIGAAAGEPDRRGQHDAGRIAPGGHAAHPYPVELRRDGGQIRERHVELGRVPGGKLRRAPAAQAADQDRRMWLRDRLWAR